MDVDQILTVNPYWFYMKPKTPVVNEKHDPQPNVHRVTTEAETLPDKLYSDGLSIGGYWSFYDAL